MLNLGEIDMSDRHELFDELEAFDPIWFKVFHNIKEAVDAASVETPYISNIYRNFLLTPSGQKYSTEISNVPDVKRAVEAMQRAEEESSLPFKLKDIGRAPSV
jgi:hypothetical protein